MSDSYSHPRSSSLNHAWTKIDQSFFEQPIIRPISEGRFQLRQILGDYNAKLADDMEDEVELFRKSDLVGKRFYLSSFPLPKRKKKFERWDKTENKYVQGEYEPSAKEKKEEDLKPGENMQVRLLSATYLFPIIQSDLLARHSLLSTGHGSRVVREQHFLYTLRSGLIHYFERKMEHYRRKTRSTVDDGVSVWIWSKCFWVHI